MKKNSISAGNVLKIAKVLMEKPVSKEEIITALNIKVPTFYKSLFRLKEAGFDIIKTKNCYKVRRFPQLLVLQPFETSILAYLMLLAHILLPEKRSKEMNSVVVKMLLLSDKFSFEETFEKFEFYKQVTANEELFEKKEAFENYGDEDRAFNITLRSGRELVLVPIDFIWHKEKIYLYCMDNTERKKKLISLERVVKIMPADAKEYVAEARETIFELSGRLARTYLLKEEERIVDNFQGRIVVANGSSDKDMLFRRLLRYDSFCKVLLPKEDAETFKN